jgi:hypothetical protein
MTLPFSEEEFLALFSSFNLSLWPALAVLWLASAIESVRLVRGRSTGREVALLLAVHWAWSGIAYHFLFFRRINPAALTFAAFFVGQSMVLAHEAWQGRWSVARGPVLRGWLSSGFLVASLLYPLLVLLDGHQFPVAPAFGVPCPTTLFTAGALLGVGGWPRVVAVVPIGWAVVGGSAAVLLGMSPDLLLFGAGAALAASLLPGRLTRAVPGRRPA